LCYARGPEIPSELAGAIRRLPMRRRRNGLPPGVATTGHIEAMAMDAGESVAAIDAIEPVAQVMSSWCAAVEGPG